MGRVSKASKAAAVADVEAVNKKYITKFDAVSTFAGGAYKDDIIDGDALVLEEDGIVLDNRIPWLLEIGAIEEYVEKAEKAEEEAPKTGEPSDLNKQFELPLQ